MEVALWNIHHGSYLMERTPLKLLLGTYNIEVTSWNVHHRSYLVEHTP